MRRSIFRHAEEYFQIELFSDRIMHTTTVYWKFSPREPKCLNGVAVEDWHGQNILRTKHTYYKVHFKNEAYILVGRKFLNHIGWKETSKSSDDSDDHLWMDEPHF